MFLITLLIIFIAFLLAHHPYTSFLSNINANKKEVYVYTF